MPYEDEIPPSASRPILTPAMERLTGEVIGAAIEVHRQLGPGLPEEAYHAAMRIELLSRSVPFESEKIIDVIYKGQRVARAKVDLLVAGVLVIELKAVEAIAAVHRLQVRTYLRLLHQPIGLLLNFNVVVLKDGIRRIENSTYES